MNYSSSQYQQFDEEEKGKRIKLNKRGVSDYDSQTRYMSRKGHRQAYEKLAEDEAEYQEPVTETVSRQRKTISVSKYTPEAIIPKSVKIQKIKDTKERFERRKEQREGKGVREAAGELGSYVADHIKKGFKAGKKPKKEKEPEPVQAQQVNDNDTIRTVSRALTTRSQELRNIEEGAFRKQNSIENKKRTAKENAKAQRRGELRGMNTFDRVVETAADTTQKVIDTGEMLEDARNKILHTQGRPKKQLTNNVKQAKSKQQVLTAAQKKRIEAQIARAAKNVSPKPRGVPFTVEKKTMTITRHTLAVSQPDMSAITGKSSKGAMVAYNRPANPNGSPKKGNPLGQRKPWRL